MTTEKPQRFGFVIRLEADKIETYRRLHEAPWPGVLARIGASKIRNYSIFLAELEPEQHYLFAYYEYVGDDHEADLRAMAEDEETLRWWRETDPCQRPIATASAGERWSRMVEVFHFDGSRRDDDATS